MRTITNNDITKSYKPEGEDLITVDKLTLPMVVESYYHNYKINIMAKYLHSYIVSEPNTILTPHRLLSFEELQGFYTWVKEKPSKQVEEPVISADSYTISQRRNK